MATTTTTVSPVTRRADAIGEVLDNIRVAVPTAKGPVVIWSVHHQHRTEIAESIRRLHTLGRTQRWEDAVENWAEAVETSTAQSFEWSVEQYAVFTFYAAS